MQHSGGRRQTAVVTCPKSMVGRVIGRNGETIKALQTYTGALIQIDQTCDPTKIAISGTPQSLHLALSMVHDIVRGTFKGFALLRQATGHSTRGPHQLATKPVYAPGYGLIPPSQLYGGDAAASVTHSNGGLLAPHAPVGGGAAYPQLLAAAPMSAAPHQYVLGVQAMPLAGPTLHTPVYNVIGTPAYTGPVFLSPMDYPGSLMAGGPMGLTAGPAVGPTGPTADMLLYTDGSSLLSQGGAGSRLFMPQGLSNMQRGASAAGGGPGGGGGGADMLSHQPIGSVSYGPAGAANGQCGMGVAGSAGGGGGGASSLLQAAGGGLVMDTEGSLYAAYVDA